jgi:[ribosomal protein S5]-alanine N-acetyltransferase
MITGNKINLRLFQSEQDIRNMYNMYNNLSERDINDHTEIYSPIDKIKKFQETGFWTEEEGNLLITDTNDSILGNIGFKKSSDFTLEIGYRIFKKENRGKGYMSEVLPLFSAYLFETVPNITRLEARTSINNIGSRKTIEKSGYTQEGILRQSYFYRGNICDFVIYSLLRSEYNSLEVTM